MHSCPGRGAAFSRHAKHRPIKLRRRLLRHLLFPRFGLALRLLAELVPGRRTRVKEALDELDRHAKQVAHEAVTEVLMTLALPDETLRLGRDVPGRFPAALERIDNADLRELLGRLDRTPDTTRGSGARSWSSLTDRINYIADLFRVHQDDPIRKKAAQAPANIAATTPDRTA